MGFSHWGLIGDLMLFGETNKGELYTPKIMWLAQSADLLVKETET